jgi:hypothetical protein
LPKDVGYTLSRFDDNSVAISFDFPDGYDQTSVRNIMSSVQKAIGKDKSNQAPESSTESSIVTPDTLIGQTTTYYFNGTQNFAGRYPGETIYNSTYGQLAATRYPAWYYVVITGTSAGVISNASSHYSGFSLETTVNLWGLIISASAPAFSVSFTPGVAATFYNQWQISSPYKYIVMDWGYLTTYTATALRLGVLNTVRVNNSGFVDPYQIYVPRTLYEY